MSIQSQIDRIVQGKQDIIAAITAKGVTVPADASIDDLAALVQAIENASDPVLQSKTVTPTTAKQTVKPDSGYDGLSDVTVNAMPAATQATPSISVSSAGLITASATQSAGYVSAGTKSATKQLTTQEAKTVTPSTSSQTAVARGRYTTGAVTVAAIPSTYVKPTTTKAATTYTPTTSNQTIASGTYCSGVQTIKGDSNLVAGNIKSGVSIFGISGSYEGSGGSGGSLETCKVAVTMKAGIGYSYYTVEDGVVAFKLLVSASSLRATTFNIIKGSYFTWNLAATLPTYRSKISVSGDIEILNASGNMQATGTGGIAFKVNGAGTIDVAE